MLHAEYGTRDAIASLTLDGAIDTSGRAMLSARGVTGKTEYNAGRVAPGAPYGYRVEAQFDEHRGSGRRLEIRACDFTFVKR